MTFAQFLELAVSLSVQAAIVVIVVHWLGRFVNSERIQCRLWTCCYVGLLLLIAVGLFLPHPRAFQPWSTVSPQSALTLVSLQTHLGRLLFLIWLGGAAISTCAFCIRSISASRFLNSCQPVDPAQLPVNDSGESIAGLLAGPSKDHVRLLSSPRLTTPFCWQFHHPFIVLPEFVLGLEYAELRFIVRHELEHLKTGHPLQLFLQRTVEVIFWFHPMVWWASQQSAASREYVCDEAAVDSPADVAVYLKTLLTIVECGASKASTTPTTLAFGRGSSVITKRARRLVQIAKTGEFNGRQFTSASKACAAFLAAIVLIAFVWLPVDVLASPRARWSPWPTWSAGVLHDFGVSARDFEVYDHRFELHELLEQQDTSSADDGEDSNK